MKEVRMGVVGVGTMGSVHLGHIKKIQGARLAAICDTNRKTADSRAKEHDARVFYDVVELIRSGEIDALIIATPHYDHTPIAIEALKAGLHVLVEKPVGVHKADVEKMIAAHTDKKLKFGAMFQQRTLPIYQKVKEVIDSGELGKITRTSWIITNWFRTQIYYDSGDWRATWAGEGGGVLLNQCPHQLDLFQWLCGMPNKVTAFCHIGKYHDIEVEDEVTAYLEYSNGATGVFVTSTGEAPGTNRLEITGEKGRLVVERGKLFFRKNEVSMSEFLKNTTQKWATPPSTMVDLPFEQALTAGHEVVIKAFVRAILDDEPLVAEAEEGIHSVELGNAMLFSSLLGRSVDIPLDGKAFEAQLKELIKNSKHKKREIRQSTQEDGSASFGSH